MARRPQRIGLPEEMKAEVEVEVKTETPIAPELKPIYKVQVLHPSLRRRAGPSVDNDVLGTITNQGIFEVYAQQNGWAQLKDGSWIMLSYCNKIK